MQRLQRRQPVDDTRPYLTATTPTRAFYKRPHLSALRSGWHLLDPELAAALPPDGPGAARGTLLPGVLNEPVVLTRDAAGTEHLLSNVCTHRAALLHDGCGPAKLLRCPYHGRRFSLSGEMTHAPGFSSQPDFPRETDNLPRLGLGSLGPLRFASLNPVLDLEGVLAPVRERIGWLPLDRLRPVPSLHRDHTVDAHWALYCDNYLEGLHIPFVHPALNASLDMASYTDVLLPRGTLQVGIADAKTPAMEPPKGHPEHGSRVLAWYFWLFPTTMLNVYPWGISANAVQPGSPTKVRFSTWTWEEPGSPGWASMEAGAAGIHETELEDEAVVERVQRGLMSERYRGGRYARSREAGLHHFHQLLRAADQEQDAATP